MKNEDVENDGHLPISKIIGQNDGDLTMREWNILNPLGVGTFGQVFKARRKINNNNKYQNAAMKIIKKEYYYCGRMEVEILKLIKKEDPTGLESLCVKMYDCFDFRGHICIALQFFQSSLYDFMSKNKYDPLPLENTKFIMEQVCQAVGFLHQNKIIHTDIKPENIMLVNIGSKKYYNPILKSHQRKLNNPIIRLIDFGSAVTGDAIQHGSRGTKYYRTPEQVLELGWSYPCDVWAVGCISFELFTGKTLFRPSNLTKHLEMFERILEAKSRNK